MDIEIRAGDIFCTRCPAALGRAINTCQAVMSRDGKSYYSHAGILIDNKGTTFEALGWRIRSQNLFEAYNNQEVVIARWEGMTQEIFDSVFDILKKDEGKIYPAWRLPLNIVPFVGKYTSIGKRFLVCSEEVGKFLYLVFRDHGYESKGGYCWPRHKWYTGTSPDTLSDEWHRWKEYEIIFEGKLIKREEE
jgi:hypothetical protein